jgi:Flp pilus assembly protein CpaB
LKRSNRLILLIGVFLAIVAFVGVVVLFSGGGGGPTPSTPTSMNTVKAAVDIPLGTTVTADMLTAEVLPIAQRDATAFPDISLVVGKVARQKITTGAQVTAAMFTARGGGTACAPEDIQITDPTHRAMAVQVDQLTGVGTVLRTGDYVDAVVGFTADKFPVVTLNAEDNTVSVVAGLNATTVKVLVQGMQVLCTLLPPPTTTQAAPAASGAPQGESGTTLTQQNEIVILEVSAQQSEVIKFGQMDGSITLTLRSPAEFRDENGQPVSVPPADTTGVTLKLLVDEYNVLIPQLVETVLPAQQR